MFCLIDNYDSFTYNLYQYLAELGIELEVYRNDKLTPAEVLAKNPEGIILSPGPCTPDKAGICLGLLSTLQESTDPIPAVLGVCLGHQSIGQSFGGNVIRAPQVMHGKVSPIHHDDTGVFAGLDNPFEATRYHSLIVERSSLPDCLMVNAWTKDDLIMGFQHETLPIHGVQFHPESILTKAGKQLLQNFINICQPAAV